MKLFFSITIIGFMILSSSCKKYLDVKPDAQLVVPTTLEDLQGILDDALVMNKSGSPSLVESYADDYFLSDNTWQSLSTKDQEIYKWSLSKYIFQNDWGLSYIPVYSANLCLERLSKMKENSTQQQEWNNIKGSALFFRSYSFLNLCWEFAKAYDNTTADTDLGIVLRTTTDFDVPSKRASVKDCYEKILKDTKEAAALLPDVPFHPMRPSKAAAYGLLSRAYLSMRQYDSCLKYANLCLQINDKLVDLNGDEDINGSISGRVPFKPFNKEMIFYFEMNRNSAVLHMYYYSDIDSTLYNSYDSSDLRTIAFFKPDNNYHTFKGSYASNMNVLFTGIATDEIYLMAAECYARMGNITEAMNTLNHLLEKRYATGTFTPATAANKDEAVNKVLSERRKELLLRGLRWMDLKRLNKEGRNIVLKRIINGEVFLLPANDPRYNLPLPDDIIKLTGMQQN
ncbi:MAG: RagB/SusD family nutrient uptake outer membrane protein [Ginsengibacter sp.]